MFALKFCSCNSHLNSYPALLKTSKFFSKTFSTLNGRTNLLLHKFKTVQSFKGLNKPQIKFELFNRKTGTVAIQSSFSGVQKSIGSWLIISTGMVYVAIALGGITRLTESGLSMVTWRFTYESFPSTPEEWLKEFEKYKEYPEFKLLKKDITLDEFKSIYKMEYVHRYWGRLIGLQFLIPAAFYWYKGHFKPAMKKRMAFFGALIVAQGLMGWYMVKSGLEDRFHKETDIPRVSQYRLAAHLGLALTLYTGLLMTALELLMPSPKNAPLIKGVRQMKIIAHSCKGLVFLTALSGALVAGLDAGLVYNSFPKMGDKWIPDDILQLTPKLKNFTENPTTVQFDHRILGITTFSAIMATWFLSKRLPLHRRAKLAVNALALVALAQVSLGISTLVHYVPTALAASHQSGSVLLLTMAIWFCQELKLLKHIPK